MSKTIKCPYCGSSKTAFWTKECRTLYYEIDKNGEPKLHLKPFRKSNHYPVGGTLGYICLDCDEWDTLDEEEDYTKWEEEQWKKNNLKINM